MDIEELKKNQDFKDAFRAANGIDVEYAPKSFLIRFIESNPEFTNKAASGKSVKAELDATFAPGRNPFKNSKDDVVITPFKGLGD